MASNLTRKQKVVLEDILVEYLQDKSEVLRDARNYGMSRRDVWALHTNMLNVALILEQAFGVKGATSLYTWSNEDIKVLCEDLIK